MIIKIPNRLELIRLLPAGSVGAEIGVYRGQFSAEILGLCPVRMLYLVDPWQKQEHYQDTINNENQEANFQLAQDAVRRYAGRYEFVRGFSVVAALSDRFIPPLDWVYIDANHAYANVKDDLAAWEGRLKPDGVLMGHDYTDGPKATEWHMGVVPAVNDFCREMGWHISHLTDEELASYRLERNQ